LVDLDVECVSQKALTRIKEQGVARKQIGVEIDGSPLPGPNTEHWPAMNGSEIVGQVTSAVYSPRLEKNIGLAMLETSVGQANLTVAAGTPDALRKLSAVPKPFFDPDKKLAAA